MKHQIEQEQQKKPIRQDTVLIYGSGQCDQFGITLSDDEQTIFQRPRVIDSNIFNDLQIKKIACGGMHTLLLTNNGKLFSWGCNDDFALGRQQDPDILIKQVQFNQAISEVSAGDSHSVAYSENSKKLYIWGQYRNIITGNIGAKTAKPTLVTQYFMKNLKIKGIASGSHHTLVHAGNKIYSWGDPESGAIGRKINTRGKNSSCLRIEAVQAKNPVKVWAGSLCSFYKDANGRIFAFGSNNYGQLGIGNMIDMYTPTKIPKFGENIEHICGGEHHTLALSSEGQVYVWGRNDDHQLGLGIEEGCLTSPTKINSLKQISQIKCGNHFSFALSKAGTIYSWGAGDQFVLGNESQETEKEPFQIPTAFFPKDFDIKCFASGAQHVVVVGSSNKESIINFKSLKDEIQEIEEDLRKKKKSTSQDLRRDLLNSEGTERKQNQGQKEKLGFFVNMSQKLDANRQGGYSGVKGKTTDQLNEMYEKEQQERKQKKNKVKQDAKKQQQKSCGFFVNKDQKQRANSKGTYLGVKGFSESQLNEIYEKEEKQRQAKQKASKSSFKPTSTNNEAKNPFGKPSSSSKNETKNPFTNLFPARPSQNFTFINPFKKTSTTSEPNPFFKNTTSEKPNPFTGFNTKKPQDNTPQKTQNSQISQNPFTKFTFKKQ